MNKEIRPIRGKQPTIPPTLAPNQIRPECIRVTKVYDWVVTTNRDRNKVPIPEACFSEIEKCRHAGHAVTATCSEVPNTRSCDIIGTRPANNPTVPGAKIVTLAYHVHIRIQFFCNGAPLHDCNFVVPVSFVDDVILCFPTGTTINCNIFDVQCAVVLNQMLGNMLVIDVVMCKDIQVEADVKLEVQAKFCGPRPVVPIEDVPIQCTIPTFPPQCPTFFPEPNCECQGLAEFIGFTSTAVVVSRAGLGGPAAGELDFAAMVCDQCDRANSSLVVTFIESPGPTLAPTGSGTELDQSFTFTADQFDFPLCTANTMTVTGTGVLIPDGGVAENATFTLNITSGTSATLQITGPTTSIVVSVSPTPGATFAAEVGPCGNFPAI